MSNENKEGEGCGFYIYILLLVGGLIYWFYPNLKRTDFVKNIIASYSIDSMFNTNDDLKKDSLTLDSIEIEKPIKDDRFVESPEQDSTAFALPLDATQIYKNTVNSTVTIETDNSLGSGFFVFDNIIATNYHVVEGCSSAYCYTNNSHRKYRIEGYLAVDKSVDLILLKVSGLNSTPIKMATKRVSPGQKIYVLGSPKGLPATISDGIVSGLRRFEGYRLIQMTAPISPGSSGGPVLNQQGELVGVSVSQFKEGQNLNFAIQKFNVQILLNNRQSYPSSFSSLDSSPSFTVPVN